MNIDDIYVGQVYEVKRIVTDEMVKLFAEATGDKNPVHLDEEYAKNTIFGGRIAHGILSLGIVSSVLGMEFPGSGTIYLMQNAKFKRPVYIGEEVTVRLVVKEIDKEKRRVLLETYVVKQNGENAIEGEALVKI
ncbi:3-hydroxybutyryl-CoA dehydratase [Fervidobacterium changbaicum]|uniref:MaoC family dehydratase n=2 Tax=Fervidobacterium TaxID=2422 RepID=A0AAI8GCJ4_FERIS|nr:MULTISPECIES: MaoC family dehydratase [Fervidobacterium]AMW32367.1 MaoC family dehydratase [Fervidobacterium islandicum]QAV32284.1 enoyl-CoA hydratase [Fervidobacterium changbaicum]QAV34048.1 enoyl-CoA hydratase [Fervidobacterium changbaicum]SDH38485.1 3-hydroxybutyryl-CoA dehydratase [Fervidobacterium changbaicum]